MIGKLKDLLRTQCGEWLVSFTTKADPREYFDMFTGKDVNIEIKKPSQKRSDMANRFCWAMCKDIGDALKPPLPKEEVYRRAIKDVGRFDTVQIREDAIERFRSTWKANGVGWFTETVDYGISPGFKFVFAYYGSSTYTVEEMSRLLDYLKQDMENMGLPIPMSKEEEERALSAWGKALCRRTSHATSAEA